MLRFHVHAHVADLDASIAFYSKLFAAPPTRVEPDYAKWMLDDPRVNFAISTRGGKPGIDHLGLQADNDAELADLKVRAHEAGLAMLDEGETTCCYAHSDKYWLTDPQGIAWEQFHTLDSIPVFAQTSREATGSACCATDAAPGHHAGASATAAATVATVPGAGCAPAKPAGRPVGIPVRGVGGCC